MTKIVLLVCLVAFIDENFAENHLASLLSLKVFHSVNHTEEIAKPASLSSQLSRWWYMTVHVSLHLLAFQILPEIDWKPWLDVTWIHQRW